MSSELKKFSFFTLVWVQIWSQCR